MDLQEEADTDSSVTIYKARLDYDEIFSLAPMLKSVWIMLAIAAFYEIWQMDKQNCIP